MISPYPDIPEGLPQAELVRNAYLYAQKAHEGQTRKYTGEPYINHPVAVARLIQGLPGMGTIATAGALLHDTIEDTKVVYEDLAREFGLAVADIVQGLTDQAPNVSEITHFVRFNRAQRKAWEAGRYLGEGYVVQTIKVADLIDNTKSIVEHDPGFASVYLREKAMLLTSLQRANKRLRAIAVKQVSDGFAAIH